MSERAKVRQHFISSAEAFDSLYCESKMNPLWRLINRRFRHDIYDRFILSMDHVRKYKLETALDVGCGSGRYALGLAELGVRRIVGIDFSPRMLELAFKNTAHIQGANGTFEFVCCDFMEFQTKETFDVVIAMGLFDYIKDPIPFLEKMKTLCNHSVIASFPSTSIYRTPIRKIRYYFKRCPVYSYDRAKISSFCSEVGFARNELVKIKGSGMDYFVAFFK